MGRMEPCLCGDPYCYHCGPLQGNSQCPICGRWDLDGGCEEPEVCHLEEEKVLEAHLEEMAREERSHG